MVGDRGDYNFFKEMLIAFLGGGSLGVFLLTTALVVVELLKR